MNLTRGTKSADHVNNAQLFYYKFLSNNKIKSESDNEAVVHSSVRPGVEPVGDYDE